MRKKFSVEKKAGRVTGTGTQAQIVDFLTGYYLCRITKKDLVNFIQESRNAGYIWNELTMFNGDRVIIYLVKNDMFFAIEK